MRYLRTFAAGGLTALALVGAGCGGDDEPSIQDIASDAGTTTTTAESVLNKQEVIATGDAICAEGNAAINQIAAETDRAIAAEQVGSITEGMRRDLRALDPPPEDKSDFNDLIQALSDQVSALEQRASTSRAGDEAAYEEAGVALESARATAQSAGEAYGFSDCGQPFDAAPTTEPPTDSGGVSPEVPTTPAPTTPPTPPPSPGGTGAPSDGGTGDSGDGGGGSGSGGISPG